MGFLTRELESQIVDIKKCIEDHDESLVELSSSVEKLEVKMMEIEKKVDDVLHGMIQLMITKRMDKPERPTFKSMNEEEIKKAKTKIECTVKDISNIIGGLKPSA